MPLLLAALFARLRIAFGTGLVIPALLSLTMLYIVGSLMMAAFEPPDSEVGQASQYWWWFFVTIFTVGYGDMAPVTTGGRIGGLLVMLGGIGIASSLVVRISELISERRRKKLRGELALNLKGHTVIFGTYVPGLAEQYVREIRRDSADCRIVLAVDATSSVTENPMSGQIEFVRGSLVDPDTLRRMCAATAANFIVCGASDYEANTLAMVLLTASGTKASIVVAADDLALARTLAHALNKLEGNQERDVRCVPAAAADQVVDELQDPGSSVVIQEVAGNDGNYSQFRIDTPEGFGSWDFDALDRYLREQFGGRIVAVSDLCVRQVDLVPEKIHGGRALFYVAPRRIRPEEFRWEIIPARVMDVG